MGLKRGGKQKKENVGTSVGEEIEMANAYPHLRITVDNTGEWGENRRRVLRREETIL